MNGAFGDERDGESHSHQTIRRENVWNNDLNCPISLLE